MNKILVFGIGNPVRGDDRLGLLFTEHMEKLKNKWPGLQIDTTQNYQLNIEDVLLLLKYDLVIFADASKEISTSYKLEQVKPKALSFSMHSFSPGMLLQIAQEYYNFSAHIWQFHITGNQWDYSEAISPIGKKNLKTAIRFISLWMEKLSLHLK